MSTTFYDILELCIQDLEQGADLESCLAKYPQYADELRPILIAAFDARSLAIPEIPAAVQRRGRARVLQHAAQMREQAPSKPFLLPFSFWRRGRLARLAVTAFSVVAFLLSGGSGLVYASNGSLPGDQLYPVKRSWENVQLWFVVDPKARQELEIKFEQERVEEVHSLFQEGREAELEFQGVVTAQNGEFWMVANVNVRIDAQTRVEGQIVPGSMVAVEGQTQPDGIFLAKEIKLIALPSALTTGTATPGTIGPEDGEHGETPEATGSPEIGDGAEPIETVAPSETNEPTETLQPEDTPEPQLTETPEPTESGNSSVNSTPTEHEDPADGGDPTETSESNG